MNDPQTVTTIPSFARVEIRIRNTDDLILAALELRNLASELDDIAGQRQPMETAVILAHHKIRAASKKTRGLA